MATILIADDQSLIRLELKEMLLALGHDVVAEAESGREAVDLALGLKPDLILMDLGMPGEINGIQAAQEINAAADIPIVFLSAHGEPPYSEAAKEAAPFGPVTKTFDSERIKAVVELALYRSEEGRLRISGERLRQIIDFLPDATFVIDTEGKLVAWNHAIEKMTGINARDILGKGDYEYAIPFYGRRRPVLIDLVSR
jgi:DNA-binding NarL/FixJ family response regulator